MEQPHASLIPSGAESLPIGQIELRYAGRWVLTEMTASDNRGTPLEGRVIAHGTRKRVNKALAAIAAAGKRPNCTYCLFAAGAFLGPANMTSDIWLRPTEQEQL